MQFKTIRGTSVIYGANILNHAKPNLDEVRNLHDINYADASKAAQIIAKPAKELLDKLALKLVEVGNRRGYKIADSDDNKTLLDVQQLKKILDDLRFPRQEADDETEVHGKTVSRSFQVWLFFEGRDGVEDDDDPDFTGYKQAYEIVKRAIPKAMLEKVDIGLSQDEKGWFTVDLSMKRT